MRTHVNLLPLAYRRRQLLVRNAKRWGVAWLIAVLLGSGLYWAQSARNHRARSRLEALRREYAPVKTMAEEVESLKAKIEELRSRESIVLSLADEQPMLTLIGLLGRAAKECDGGLFVQRLQLDRRHTGAGNQFVKVLQLEGTALDNQLVARFAAALRDTEAFRQVELKSSGRQGAGEMDSQNYTLECTF